MCVITPKNSWNWGIGIAFKFREVHVGNVCVAYIIRRRTAGDVVRGETAQHSEDILKNMRKLDRFYAVVGKRGSENEGETGSVRKFLRRENR